MDGERLEDAGIHGLQKKKIPWLFLLFSLLMDFKCNICRNRKKNIFNENFIFIVRCKLAKGHDLIILVTF